MIHKQYKRERLVRKFAARRAELKSKSRDLKLSPEERQSAREALSALPRNSSPVRLRTRCVVSGRPRAVYKEFMLSRIAFRAMALRGELPGIHKASW
jgi:small subunit ribosomal protein S14